MNWKRASWVRGLSLGSVFALLVAAHPPNDKIVYISYAEARPVLEALPDNLPAELKGKSPARLAELWPAWVARQDQEIRSRLVQGEEDSLVNFLLFGTSFTKQPRSTAADLERLAARQGAVSGNTEAELKQIAGEVVEARVDDLVRGLAAPGNNERLVFARRLVEQNDVRLDTAQGRQQAKLFVLSNLARVLKEQAGYATALEAARRLGDPSEEFAQRSTLYHTRGLSVDTSLRPNLGIEAALRDIKRRGLLAPGSVRRVAIIGPGLDFTDKQAGYDFYPLQSIQPFALIDTLLRLGLARPGGLARPAALAVTTLDISTQVNQHLARAGERARRGLGYTIQLPLDPRVDWKPGMMRYWERFGDRIGAPAPPAAVPASLGGLKLRAVRVGPAIVARITPVDLNVVVQRVNLSSGEKFDLVVATNMFVYYDVFEQSLALANVQSMLRPGGFLLSNNALFEPNALQMHSVDYTTVVYSDQPDDGDQIVWYRRAPN